MHLVERANGRARLHALRTTLRHSGFTLRASFPVILRSIACLENNKCQTPSQNGDSWKQKIRPATKHFRTKTDYLDTNPTLHTPSFAGQRSFIAQDQSLPKTAPSSTYTRLVSLASRYSGPTHITVTPLESGSENTTAQPTLTAYNQCSRSLPSRAYFFKWRKWAVLTTSSSREPSQHRPQQTDRQRQAKERRCD